MNHELFKLIDSLTDDVTIVAIITAIASVVTVRMNVRRSMTDQTFKLEKQFEKLDEKLIKVREENQDQKVQLLRIQLQHAIEHNYGMKVVGEIYRKYRLEGGNSYMEDIVNQYFVREEKKQLLQIEKEKEDENIRY